MKTHRNCPHCLRLLPLSKFYLDAKSKDGHATWCKSCMTIAVKLSRNLVKLTQSLLVMVIAAFLCASAFADTVNVEKPTKRMHELEVKYNAHILCIMRDSVKHVDYWIFMILSSDRLFNVLPVAVPKDCTDHDMDVAIDSALNCADFYETEFKRLEEKAEETPGQKQSNEKQI